MSQWRVFVSVVVATTVVATGCALFSIAEEVRPAELLAQAVERARDIRNARVSGQLLAGETELHYEGVARYDTEAGTQKLLAFRMRNEDGKSAGVEMYVEPQGLFVRWPGSPEWTPLGLDPGLAEGWLHIVEQTRMADPVYALTRMQEAAREVVFVTDETVEGRKYRVLRISTKLERALELFRGVLPPEVPAEAYVGVHHTLWVAADTLEPYLFSIHVQLAATTGELPPIHMEFRLTDINRTMLTLPPELESLLAGGAT